MKFQIENLGVIRYAEIELGNMTVICGMNNFGKTYIAYAIYGFMHFWETAYNIRIEKEIINKLKDSGVHNLALNGFAFKASDIINDACIEYTKCLPSVFSSQKIKFENVVFKIKLLPNDIVIENRELSIGISSSNAKTRLTFYKEANKDELTITLFSENNEAEEIPDFIIAQTISDVVKSIVFKCIFPSTFIASAERTGAAIYRRELNFARNKILEAISKKDAEIDPFILIKKGKADYAWPVKHDVDFVRSLESVSKSESDLYVMHKDVIASFKDILGGDYQVTDKDELYFTPANKLNRKIQLTMDESSSSVRALLDIGFFIKHVAENGDLLMIDEPELNLHPSNQRKIARLLSSLINCDLKVFITTHSDYILRELSNLVLLNGNSSRFSAIIDNEGYKRSELISSADIRIYNAEDDNIILPDKQRKTKVKTLVPVPVDSERGILASCYDDTINDMNRITDEILFGG